MIVEVRVITNAKRREVGLEGSSLRVKVTSPPQDGKANEELLDYLSAFLGVKKSQVKILRGEKVKRKTLSIPIGEEELLRRIKGDYAP